MGCDLHIDPAGVRTFICGEGINEPAPPCKFCSEPSVYLCDWVGPKEVTVPAEELSVGDIWITQQNHKRAKVVQIDRLGYHGLLMQTDNYHGQRTGELTGKVFTIRFWISLPGATHNPYALDRYPPGEGLQQYCVAVTEREASCDEPTCEAHVREVGDERHYCRRHWNAWSEV